MKPKINFLARRTVAWSPLVILLIWIGLIGLANAEPSKVGPPEITKATLQTKIDALNNRQGLDEAVKANLLKYYQSAEDYLGNAETFNNHAAEYKQAIKDLPEKTKQLQKELAKAQAETAKPDTARFSALATEELERRLVAAKENISSLNAQLKKLENSLALQEARPQLIRQETIAAQQELAATQKKLELPTGKESQAEKEAAKIYLKTLLDARTAELKMLDIEAISNPIQLEWLKAQQQLLLIQKDAAAPLLAAAEIQLAQRRQQEAHAEQNALSQTEQELAGKHPVLQRVSRENIQYSRDLQAITEKIDRYNAHKSRLDALAADIESEFKNADKKIKLAGLSPALGKILREQRRNLLAQTQEDKQSELVQDETAQASLEQFKIEDQQKMLANTETSLRQLMATEVKDAVPEAQRASIESELRTLLDNQKELLNKLSEADTLYLRTLGDFDFARQQMILQANKFATYLDEHLLWVRSSTPVDLKMLADLYPAAQWLLAPHQWLKVAQDTWASIRQSPFLSFMALSIILSLLVARRWLKNQMTIVNAKVGNIATDHAYYTLEAFVYIALWVLPAPFISYSLGWLLTTNSAADPFALAVGNGLQAIAVPYLVIQFCYRLLAADGIARKHFHWRELTVSLLQRQLGWLRWLVVPTVFIIATTGAAKIYAHSDSLGRVALMAGMVGLGVVLHRVFNLRFGLLPELIKAHPDGWLNRFRHFWYPLALLLPLIIIGFAASGYYLSALELQQKLVLTLRLLFFTTMLHALVFRWLNLVNRQLAIANAKQKRKAAVLSAQQQTLSSGEDTIVPLDEGLIDIPKINAQTLNLLHVFIGFGLLIGGSVIWQNILPAFAFLEHIVLWQHPVTINNQESSAPVTLTNFLLAGLYGFITIVSINNFSGIMELFVFRHLTIEAGLRYAINQLATYFLFSVGFIFVANELGGSWGQVQWLVAALGVGLGFGLQEIFANLVSGIILLFERPIRVGDTVTIGEVTGKVSRIQMRATTIKDWDQKELVVPNKTFITNQLVNWTLSDPITRLVISVSIGYNSDVEQAHKILLATVQNTPQVRPEPEPSVLFTGFGDSALNFTIYVYVSELSQRLQLTHDLHVRLLQALRDHNIEIPFPQQDIHIRSVTPGLEKSFIANESHYQSL